MSKVNKMFVLLLIMIFSSGMVMAQKSLTEAEKIKLEQQQEMEPMHQVNMSLANDVDPSPNTNGNTAKAVGDIIWDMDVETIVGNGDNQFLGCEFANGSLWVTSRGDNGTLGGPTIYEIDVASSTVLNTYPQTGVTSTWGIRDLAYDPVNDMIYGGDDNGFYSIDPSDGTVTTLFTGQSFGVIRALAYDGTNFWTKSFGGDLHEFDINGNLLNSYTLAESTYGAAYDPDAGTIWLFASTTTFYEVDPATGTLTGNSYALTLPNAGIVGGAFYDFGNIVPGKIILGLLGQGTPDVVYGMEFGEAADPSAPAGVENLAVTPDAGGALTYDITWDNPTLTVDGSTLTSITDIELYVNDTLVTGQTWDLGVGNTNTASGLPVNYAGMQSFKVVAINASGEGLPVTISEWVGEDVPDAPGNIVLADATVAPDKIASLTWDAPTAGLHGGYFTGTGIVYDIVRYPGGTTVATDYAGTQPYLDTVAGIDTYQYEITAKNSIGAGGAAMSNQVIVGLVSATIPFTEDFEAGNTYFLLSSEAEADVFLNPTMGNAGTQGLHFTGASFSNWSGGSTSTTATQAWVDNTDHHASAIANVDATSITAGTGLMLKFKLRQTYTYGALYSWFRVKVNGTPIQDIEGNENFNPVTKEGDPFVDRIFDLTAFSGTNFTIEFQSSCKYDDANYSSGIGDNAFVDDIVVMVPPADDLEAVSLNGSSSPSQNTPTLYDFTVFNNGSVLQDTFDLQIFNSATPGAYDTVFSFAGDTILPLEQRNFQVYWRPDFTGVGSIYGVVVNPNDGMTINDTTPVFNVDVLPEGSGMITIGSGTGSDNEYPLNYYWKNSLSQSLYYEAEFFGLGGMIDSIAWNNTFVTDLSSTGQGPMPVKIWMAQTPLNDLSGGWVSANDMTLVFDGMVEFPAGENTINIPLTTPFMYTGVGNLLIMSNRPMDPQWYDISDEFYFSTDAGSARSLEEHSDGTTFDPYNPPTGTTPDDDFPNTSFYLTTGGLGALDGMVYDENAVGMDSVEIQIVGTPFKTYTNDTGYYNFPYLVADTVDIRAEVFGYFPDTAFAKILVTDSTVEQDFTLTPIPTYDIDGFVEGADNPGTGIVDAEIHVIGYGFPDDGVAEDSTDINGDFLVTGLYDLESYDVIVKAAGYQDCVLNITINGANQPLGTISLIELLIPVSEVTGVVNGNSVDVTWNQPGNVLGYFQDFNSPLTDWLYSPNSNNQWSVSGGYLVMTGTSIGETVGASYDMMFDDFVLEFHMVKDAGSTTGGMGAVIHGDRPYNPYTEPFNGYRVNLTQDGSYGVFEFTGGAATTIQTWTPSANANTGLGNANIVTIEGIGNDYELIINGASEFTWNDANHPNGQLGLQVYDNDAADLVNFDYFYITEPDKKDVVKEFVLANNDMKFTSASDAKSTTQPITSNPEFTDGEKSFNNSVPLKSIIRTPNNGIKAVEGYEVYRLLDGEQGNPAAWTLIATNTSATDTTATDPDWTTLTAGLYVYAVVANYTSGDAPAAFSDVIPNNMEAEVTVNVTTNGGDDPAGATVKLTNQDGNPAHIYELDAPSGGVTVFPAVWKGTYDMRVSLMGYDTHEETIVVDDDLSVNVELAEKLIPVMNLTITPNGNVATYEWDEPVAGTPQWMHYDGDNNDAIGTGAAAQFDVAARFAPADLATMNVGGLSVTEIKFYPNEAASTYSVKVWTGGNATAPGSLVVDQAVASPTIGDWNTVVLDNPVMIDPTQELWIGFGVNTTAGYPAGCDAGPQDEGKGNMMYWQGSWTTLTALNAALTYNWNVRGYAGYGKGGEKVELSGKALEGYLIYLDDMTTPIDTTTDLTYNVINLETGSYEGGVAALYSGGVSPLETQLFDIAAASYTVTFNVTSQGNAVEGANITVTGVGTVTSDINGVATILLADGTYEYIAEKTGVGTDTGSFEVAGADLSVDVNLIVGINETDLSEMISMYPNPAKDQVIVKSDVQIQKITMLNSFGAVVKELNINNTEKVIDVRTLDNGIYYIRFETENGTALRKLNVVK